MILGGRQPGAPFGLGKRDMIHDGTFRLWKHPRQMGIDPIRVNRAAIRTRPGQAAASATRGGAARSEEHTSELQSLMRISYAVFCLKKKNTHTTTENRQ